MRTIEFRNLLDENNATRVQFETERNQVLRFVVQLECRFGEEWHAVVRYDTAHGFAHRDTLHPYGKTVKTDLDIPDYNAALTFAIQDLSENWRIYRERYKEWQLQRKR